jgi:hypothetical protein
MIQFDFKITMQVSKKGNSDECKIGLERVVASKFDKGLEEVILKYISYSLSLGPFKVYHLFMNMNCKI